MENAVPGKPAKFVVKAIGKNLTYTWHRQTSKSDEKRVFMENTQILHIDKVEASDEGYYVCTICNTTGTVETKPARLTTSMYITVLLLLALPDFQTAFTKQESVCRKYTDSTN